MEPSPSPPPAKSCFNHVEGRREITSTLLRGAWREPEMSPLFPPFVSPEVYVFRRTKISPPLPSSPTSLLARNCLQSPFPPTASCSSASLPDKKIPIAACFFFLSGPRDLSSRCISHSPRRRIYLPPLFSLLRGGEGPSPNRG